LITNQPLDIVYLLGKIWFHGKSKNNWLLLVLAQKQNVMLWHPLLLNLYGSKTECYVMASTASKLIWVKTLLEDLGIFAFLAYISLP
jgi:hypothetical protein